LTRIKPADTVDIYDKTEQTAKALFVDA